MHSFWISSAPLALVFAASQSLAHPPGHGGTPPPSFKGDYEYTVCHPLTDTAPKPVPPCIEIETIEIMCTPNGTSPLALKAHQECMCGGSFFAEWPYCLQCLYLHGLRSQRDVFFYRDVIATASNALCEVPTPTAEFKSIFESAQGVASMPTTGETINSDQAVGQTAVSLYYTATVSQGPGRITGEATAATATATGLLLAPSSQPGNTDADDTDDTGLSTIPSTSTHFVSTPVGSTRATTTSPVLNTNATTKNKRLRKGSVLAAVIAIAAALVI